MHERSDQELMAEWADGAMTAFEALYERHRAPLYRYVLRQAGDAATANDLYQGAWEKVIRGRRSYRTGVPFRAWLFRIAHNHVVDHYRRQRPGQELHPERIESSDDGPEEALERAERRERLEQAVAQLPEKQRDAILLKLEGGLGLEEIADVLDVNRETAKSRLRYAVSRLKEALGDSER